LQFSSSAVLLYLHHAAKRVKGRGKHPQRKMEQLMFAKLIQIKAGCKRCCEPRLSAAFKVCWCTA